MKKILIVDDDSAIVDATQMVLEMEGYEVNTSLDGNILNKMENNTPDLILLDIWMSGEDGRDVARLLKSTPHTKKIPIVMISANRDAQTLASECGANDFLAKPFEIDDLIKTIKKHLH